MVFISGPVISSPSSSSNEIPDEVMSKGKAIGGDIEDFATFINLWPTRDKKTVIGTLFFNVYIFSKKIYPSLRNEQENFEGFACVT